MESLNWIGWLLALVASVFAFKANVRFDVNAWLKDRREEQKERLRALCTHVHVAENNGAFVVRPAFVSPAGALAWQCQICGTWTHDRELAKENTAYWATEQVALRRRLDEIDRLAKKLGRPR